MKFQIGFGYDIHRLLKGRKLFLGGVEIPHDKGLAGHSDADVVLHAICDALLGALGQGDIGEHFPTTDPQYRGISSLVLLKKVFALVKKKGLRVNNIDTVILAEKPHLKVFKSRMSGRIARLLEMASGKVNIKVTTQEGLGPIGKNEAMAAYATVLLVKKGRA
jgi:2-C-methyl-D-erythritol 2,4-cyclodiphosphate synthase